MLSSLIIHMDDLSSSSNLTAMDPALCFLSSEMATEVMTSRYITVSTLAVSWLMLPTELVG